MSVIDFCCILLRKPDAMETASLWADMILQKAFWTWTLCVVFLLFILNYLPL
jgi:hypothetical protein